MDDFALDLQLPEDPEQRGAEQFAALFFNELRMNDDVGQAAFIFQRDEDDAGRRARPLAEPEVADCVDAAGAWSWRQSPESESAAGRPPFSTTKQRTFNS